MEHSGGNNGIRGKGSATNVRSFVAPSVRRQPAPGAQSAGASGKEKNAYKPERVDAPIPVKFSRKKPSEYDGGTTRRGRSAIIAGIAVVLLIIMGGACILGYYMTIVETISIEGCDSYTDAAILNMAGLYTGKNIFAYDLNAAKVNISRDPYIEVLAIKREFPSTILIQVRERKEYAAIAGAGGTYCIIDDCGFILDIARRDPIDGLILVYGLSTGGFWAGTSIDADKSILRNYTLCTMLASAASHGEKPASIDLSNISDIRVDTFDHFTVYLGDAEDLLHKMERMYTALERLRQSQAAGGVIYINSNGSADYSVGTPAPTAAPVNTATPFPSPHDDAPDD